MTPYSLVLFCFVLCSSFIFLSRHSGLAVDMCQDWMAPKHLPMDQCNFLALTMFSSGSQSRIMNRWLAHNCLQPKQYWRHIWSPTKCTGHVIIFTWTSQINKIKLKINLIQYQNQELSNFQALLSKICQVQQECHIANHTGINFLLNICRRC